MEAVSRMSKKHKLLITGSSGMLGTDLCQELGGDYEVWGIDLLYRLVPITVLEFTSLVILI